MTNYQKGKTYEELYGKKKADKIKEKLSIMKIGKVSKNKGKKYEEIYGKEKSNKLKLRKSKKLKGKPRWSKEKIIKNLHKIIKKTGLVTRFNLPNLCHYYDICSGETIRRQFGSLDNLAIESNIEFKIPKNKGMLGDTEKEILDNIELEKGIKLIRQYSVAGKYIDGYDKINNIAYEVDEWHHKYQKIEDIIREDKIKKLIGCKFVRVRT